MFRCIQLQQQHNKDAMVWKLLKLTLPHFMILEQNPHYNTENLEHNTGGQYPPQLPYQKPGTQHERSALGVQY